jgi:opacity protein-like surface antigen
MCKYFKFMVVVFAVATLGAIVPGPAQAETLTKARTSDRGGQWEFSLPLDYSPSTSISGHNGTSTNIDSDFGVGLGIGYNFNDNFQLNGIMNLNSRGYTAKVVKTGGVVDHYGGTMDTFSMGLNAVYYLLKGNITPFISGGVGFAYVDSNVQNGPVYGVCWYDPWWGYICDANVPTKSETDVTFNAGIGVRYDINDRFALQGGYYKNWIDLGKSSGMPDIDIWRLSIVFKN